MPNFAPAALDAQRQRWLRPDWQRWMRPDAKRWMPLGTELSATGESAGSSNAAH